MNIPGTIITIDGTVRVILGKPTFFLSKEASNPEHNAPINAAALAGIDVKSISSRRKVFTNIPIIPAVNAILRGLLNISEKPYTPQKLVVSLNKSISMGLRESSINSDG